MGTVKKSRDGMLQTPGMVVGLVVLWWERGAEGAEIDKAGMLFWLEKKLSWLWLPTRGLWIGVIKHYVFNSVPAAFGVLWRPSLRSLC